MHLPKTPKKNAYAARFNRTIEDCFVDSDEELLGTDLAHSNRTLADWLVLSNTERPRHSLRSPSPRSCL